MVTTVTCVLVAVPVKSSAQTKEDAEDFVEDVLWGIFGPNQNLFIHGGASTNGRFVLQSPVGSGGGQRALRGDDAFSVGAGVGVDILLRTGSRLTYTYTHSDLVFRTDNGDDSHALDMNDIGELRSHAVSLEVMRYMLPARADITPYATAGIVGAWWVLDEESDMVVPSGGSTQFRPGGLATFGLQGKLNDHVSARLEGSFASVRNPFTGNESFRALGGTTLDEPTRVGKNDFRVIVVYHFSRPDLPGPLENLQRRTR
jgi:hypothetical protein